MFNHFKIVAVQIYFVDATALVSFGLSRVSLETKVTSPLFMVPETILVQQWIT
jgi:hypothetical protein